MANMPSRGAGKPAPKPAAKPAGKPLLDSFVAEVAQDTWILFPWDTYPQFIAPLARRTD